jgi:DHA1 family multidrug resistance protein-like MFS transporter
MIHAFANSFVGPIIQTFLSKETDEKSQGSILGLNASYISIGTIFGPIIGGIIATVSIEGPFLAACMFIGICILLSYKIMHQHKEKLHAF